MANAFSKEEKVAFDQMLEGFDDALVVSRMAKVTQTDQTTMERTGDIIWFPQPYIMTSHDGNDASSNFDDVAQLSVPATINTQKHVPWVLTARELRDAMQEGSLKDGAEQRLGSDINVDVMNTASLYGSIVVKQTVVASGFDDLALCDAIMTEQGIGRDSRVYGASPRDYNNMASDLAQRTLDNSKSLTAYEAARVGRVAGFETYKMDYAYRLTAALGVTCKIDDAEPLYYTPVSHTTVAGIGKLNVDNRFQTIKMLVTSGAVKVGDAFTIAGVYSVHHITKQSTGQLKTFRIAEIVSGAGGTGNVKITPPIISGTGGTNPELMYQNVNAAPADQAAITFLNTVAANCNVFWQGDALQILPGRLAPASDSGLAVMHGTTSQGFQLVMTRQGEINDLTTKYRLDAIWGSFMANPEMAGIELFSQS